MNSDGESFLKEYSNSHTYDLGNLTNIFRGWAAAAAGGAGVLLPAAGGDARPLRAAAGGKSAQAHRRRKGTALPAGRSSGAVRRADWTGNNFITEKLWRFCSKCDKVEKKGPAEKRLG